MTNVKVNNQTYGYLLFQQSNVIFIVIAKGIVFATVTWKIVCPPIYAMFSDLGIFKFWQEIVVSPDTILTFVGIIVGACVAGGAIYSGLAKIADAIKNTDKTKT